MSKITTLLDAIQRGEALTAEKLLPLVYEELRKLAAQKLAQEKPGQTLQATALVHEVYLRLVGGECAQCWDSRGHFFAAAAEAMRRILVETARRKRSQKHGGGRQRLDIDQAPLVAPEPADALLDLDEALDRLQQVDALAAEVVKLRYFAGLTMQETAEALRLPLRTAERNWTFARTWLHRELVPDESEQPPPTNP